MTPTFLLSVCNSHRVIYNKKLNVEKIYKRLKPREVNTLIEMCNELKKASPKLSIFDGYFVGYVIPKISNEFDLLRFSDDLVINIEIKNVISDFNRATSLILYRLQISFKIIELKISSRYCFCWDSLNLKLYKKG